MSASDLSDESLLRYYDSIRKQVEADRGNRRKFMTSDSIKEYAESLRLELYKRRLPHTPIDWWTDQQTDTVTPPQSNASDLASPDRNPVVDASAVESTAKTKLDNREQPNDLQRHNDALMKGLDQTSED